MLPDTKRSAHEWFDEAARYYLEGHQACAWCGGQYRVFKGQHGSRQEYSCKECDFYVCHDHATNSYTAEWGREDSAKSAGLVLDPILSRHGCLS